MLFIHWSFSLSLLTWSNIYLAAFVFFILGLIIGFFISSMKKNQGAELHNKLETSRKQQDNLENELMLLESKMDSYKNQIGDLEDELINAKKNIEYLKRDR